MDPLRYRNNALHLEDLSLETLAEEYGTPLYCYSAARIEKNFSAYVRALSRVAARKNFTVCYACKANGNLAILTLLRKQGAGADIVSGGEMRRALAAGIPASKIVFSGVGKDEKELAEAIKYGLLQINVESEGELETISRIARRLKKTVSIALRVNPDVDAGTHAKITTGRKHNKFGIDIGRAPAFYKKAAKLPGIRAEGVAVHIGSQLTALSPFASAYRRVAKLVKTLRADGHDIRRVDLGGGIGIRYQDETTIDLDEYAKLIRDIILPLGVHVVIEPGRSIVGDAGVLLSRVRQIKRGTGKTFAILDAGMNDLLRPALYDARHAVLPCRKKGGKKEIYDIVGPVCESADIFLKDEKTQRLSAGDFVAIACAGAYGASMSSAYNAREPAHEVMVRGKKSAAVRKKRDLLRDDIVPPWA